MQTVLYLLFWAGLIFLMMRFGCGAHIMGHGRHGRHEGENGLPTPGAARDPVCGMQVKPQEAKTSVWQGKAYYFCSQSCRDRFEAAPQHWLERPIADPKTNVHQEGAGHGAA